MMPGMKDRLKQPGPRVLSGPESVAAATKLRALNDKHQLWPYDWLFQPKNGKLEMPFGVIPAPAVATPTAILTYQVPTGFNYAMVGMLAAAPNAGSGFVEGSGNALWSTFLNPSTQNLPLPNLGNIPFSMGSFDNGWWKFPATFVFVSLDIIQIQVTTTIDITPGPPTYFVAIFEGWLYPSAEETKTLKR